MEFGKVVAVDDLSWEIQPGRIVGLIGPNGAGKTTLLRLISGILPPVAGRVSVCGFDLGRSPVEAKHRLAFVPDDPALFDGLTVWEHVRFTAAMYRVPDYVETATRLLEVFDLWEKRGETCGGLSRGMRHKAGLCLAFLTRPRLLLLDEPLAGLDPRAIRALKTRLRRLAAGGASVILSSHLLHLIEDLCAEVLVMAGGKRRCQGSVQGLSETAAQSGKGMEEIFLDLTKPEEPVPPGEREG